MLFLCQNVNLQHDINNSRVITYFSLSLFIALECPSPLPRIDSKKKFKLTESINFPQKNQLKDKFLKIWVLLKKNYLLSKILIIGLLIFLAREKKILNHLVFAPIFDDLSLPQIKILITINLSNGNLIP